MKMRVYITNGFSLDWLNATRQAAVIQQMQKLGSEALLVEGKDALAELIKSPPVARLPCPTDVATIKEMLDDFERLNAGVPEEEQIEVIHAVSHGIYAKVISKALDRVITCDDKMFHNMKIDQDDDVKEIIIIGMIYSYSGDLTNSTINWWLV